MNKVCAVLLSLGLSAALVGCATTDNVEAKMDSMATKGPVPVTGSLDHEAMLQSDDPQLAANKRLVYDMWRTLLDARDVDAARKYLAPDYIQHNPMVDTGRESILSMVASFGSAEPIQDRVKADIVAIVAERDLVALIQVSPRNEPHPYTTTWFDLFRVEDGKITEHWDPAALPPGMTPANYVPTKVNPNYQQSLASNAPELRKNKKRVYDMWRTLLDAQQVSEAPKYLALDYIQHNPMANTGLHGFMSFFEQFAQPKQVEPEVKNFIEMIAEDDLVVLATVSTRKDSNGNPYNTTWFDMFRVDGRKMTEHWDSATIPVQ
ncbi:MAG: nuclear transport factor 2 family protein [Reinekea sp.]